MLAMRLVYASVIGIITFLLIHQTAYGQSSVIINEVELNPYGNDDEQAEQVELYNSSEDPINVGGWTVSSTAGKTSTMPDRIIIPSRGFLIVDSDSQWLENAGETIVLRDNSGNTIDTAGPFDDNNNDNLSWQRVFDGSSEWKFRPATLGYTNGKDQSTEVSGPDAGGSVQEIKNISFMVAANNVLAEVKLSTTSNISYFQFVESEKRIFFRTDGSYPSTHTEIAVQNVLEGPYTVLVDGAPARNFKVFDNSLGEKIISIDTDSETHDIAIIGTNVVPEFPLGIMGALAAIIGVIIVIQRFQCKSPVPV